MPAAPVVLSRSELERIKASTQEVIPINYEQKRRQELKEKSNDRLKHWPNTLEALRLKKENFTKERAEAEEEKRREIDRVEAELRRKNRLESIQRANEMLYDQTDKMKLFHRQQKYADCLADRQLQIQRKQLEKEQEKAYNAQFHVKIIEKVKHLTEIEESKVKKQHDSISLIKQSREEQINDVKARREAADRENIAMGIAMKKQIQDLIQQDIIAAEEKQLLIAKNNAAMVVANERLKAVKNELRQKEAEAELERESEVMIIEDRKKIRKVIELRRFEKQQETRQKIIDAAIKQLAEKASTDNAIQSKQENEIKEKQDKYFADKEAKRVKEWNLTVTSRAEQMKAREERRRLQMEEDDRQVILMNKVNQEEIQKAQQRVIDARTTTKTIKDLQFVEGVQASRKKVEDKLIEIEESRLIEKVNKQDDTKYTDIVKAEIMNCAAAGKPVYTLLKALDYQQPDLIGAKLSDKKSKTDKK